MKITKKRILIPAAPLILGASLFALTACSSTSSSSTVKKPLVIYTNADTEAENVMKSTLDSNGFKGDYKFVDFGSADLNTKILAEGKNLQADMITLSTFYIDSAQKSTSMFATWNTPTNGVNPAQNFQSPILGLEGSLIINTYVLKQHNLPTPTSIKDLSNPIYKGYIAFPSLQGSTTGWLMVQALISQYGESEAQTIFAGLIKNAGAHVEMSGSAPVQDVTSGEVAVAFGLRQQGVEAGKQGQPIKVVDPVEGNYVLTESVAVLNHKNMNPDAEKAAELIATKSRPAMQQYYPPVLFTNEKQNSDSQVRGKFFSQALTTDLLKQHIAFFEAAKAEAAK